MSQHYWNGSSNSGEKVSVMTGFDRRVGGFHLTVEKADELAEPASTPREDAPLYCNMRDVELLPTMGSSDELGYFRDRLQSLGIDVPESVFAEVEKDQVNNAGNRIVVYDVLGNVESDSDSPPASRPRAG